MYRGQEKSCTKALIYRRGLGTSIVLPTQLITKSRDDITGFASCHGERVRGGWGKRGPVGEAIIVQGRQCTD